MYTNNYDTDMASENPIGEVKRDVAAYFHERGAIFSIDARMCVAHPTADINEALDELEMEGVLARSEEGRLYLVKDYGDVRIDPANRREVEALEIVAMWHTPPGEVHESAVLEKVGREAVEGCVSMRWMQRFESMAACEPMLRIKPRGWATLYRHWRKRTK